MSIFRMFTCKSCELHRAHIGDLEHQILQLHEELLKQQSQHAEEIHKLLERLLAVTNPASIKILEKPAPRPQQIEQMRPRFPGFSERPPPPKIEVTQ